MSRILFYSGCVGFIGVWGLVLLCFCGTSCNETLLNNHFHLSMQNTISMFIHSSNLIYNPFEGSVHVSACVCQHQNHTHLSSLDATNAKHSADYEFELETQFVGTKFKIKLTNLTRFWKHTDDRVLNQFTGYDCKLLFLSVFIPNTGL